MKRGTKVSVSGGATFTGIVLVATADRMVIEIGPGMSTTLFRDCASTKPQRWQCAGIPVEVHAQPAEGFRKRLRELEARTRNF